MSRHARIAAWGTAQSGIGAIAPALPVATGGNEGLLELLFVHTNAAQSPTTPAGWTLKGSIAVGSGSGSSQCHVYYRRYVTGDGAPSVADTGDHQLGRIVGIRGAVESGDPFGIFVTNTDTASNTSATVPAATVTSPDELLFVVIVGGFDTAAAPVSTWDSGGAVGAGNDFATSSGTGGGVSIATMEAATAGSYGPWGATLLNATSKAYIVFTIKRALLPYFVTVTAWASNTAALPLTIPSLTREGDIILAVLETRNTQGITMSGYADCPSSPIDSSGVAGVNETRLTALWKRAVAGESNPTTSDSGDHQDGFLVIIGGVDKQGDPFDAIPGVDDGGASAAGASGTSWNIPAVTTSFPGSLIVDMISQSASGTQAFSGWTNANLTDLAERADTGGGGNITAGIGIATGTMAGTGSTGTTAVTNSLTTTAALMKLAFRAQQVAPPFTSRKGPAVASYPDLFAEGTGW